MFPSLDNKQANKASKSELPSLFPSANKKPAFEYEDKESEFPSLNNKSNNMPLKPKPVVIANSELNKELENKNVMPVVDKNQNALRESNNLFNDDNHQSSFDKTGTRLTLDN